MQDDPPPEEILALVAAFLREEAVPALTGRAAFHARVAANAVELVRRQVTLALASDASELVRLRALFSEPAGAAGDLNARLADGLARGALDLETPGVREHLWRTTLEKLAVDQPSYASRQRTLAELAERKGD